MNNVAKAGIIAVLIAIGGIAFFVLSKEDKKPIDTDLFTPTEDEQEAVEVSTLDGPDSSKLALTKSFSIRGSVKSASGKGLAAKIVVFELDGGSTTSTRSVAEVAASRGGLFTIAGLKSGRYSIRARIAGYQEGRIDKTLSTDNSSEAIDFVLESGLTISGYVKDANGKAIEGAIVKAFKEPSKKDASMEERLKALAEPDTQNTPSIDSTTDSQGWFQISGLKKSEYDLTAVAASYAMGKLRFVEAGTSDVLFKLEPGGALSGVIRVLGGDPVEGAVISAHPMPGQEDIVGLVIAQLRPAMATAVSDENGQYSLDQIGGGGKFKVSVVAKGLQAQDFDIEVSSGDNERYDIDLSQGLVIRGVAYSPDGEPLANTTVKLNQQGGTTTGRASLRENIVLTKEDGAFLFDTLGEGSFRIVCSHDDYASVQKNRVQPSENEEHELELTIGGAISGTITSEHNGVPISEARIMVRDGVGVEKEAITDSNGTYTVRGVAVPRKRKVTLSASAEGYAQGSYAKVEIAEGIVTEGTDFALKKNGVVEGIVTDAAGAPVVGCRISVRRQESAQAPVVRTVGASVVSDAAGKFRILNVNPGEGSFLLGKHNHFLESESDSFEIAPGEEVTGLTLMMRSGGAISGIVVDESDQPIENACVALQDESMVDLNPCSMSKVVRSSKDGSFRIPSVHPGEDLVLLAQAKGYLRAELKNISVDDNGEQAGLVFKLIRGSHLDGMVVDKAGDPIKGAQVTILDSSDGLRRITLRTDGRGKFSADDLGKWEVRVEATAKGYTKAEILEYPVNTSDLVITLERLGGLTGRVVGSNGAEVRAFSVLPKVYFDGRLQTRSPSKTFQRGREGDGSFTYESLQPGDYQITVGAPGFDIVVIDNITVQADSYADLGVIEINQGGIIRGRVVSSETGEAIAGALVKVNAGAAAMMPPVPAVGTPGFKRGRRGAPTRTKADGTFEIIGLRAQSVTLEISHREFLPFTVSSVPANGDELTIELESGGVIEVYVQYQNGSGAPGRQVLLSGPVGAPRRMDSSRDTDRKGTVFFTGLLDGTYNIVASNFGRKSNRGGLPKKGGTATQTVEVSAGETVRVELVLDEAPVKGGSKGGDDRK